MHFSRFLVFLSCLVSAWSPLTAHVTAADYGTIAELVLEDEMGDARSNLDALILANPDNAELLVLRDKLPPPPVAPPTKSTPIPVPLPESDQGELQKIQELIAQAKTFNDRHQISRRLEPLVRRHRNNVELILLQLQVYTGYDRDSAVGATWELQRLGLWDYPAPAVQAAQLKLEKLGWILSAKDRKATLPRHCVITARHLEAATQAALLARAERRRTATLSPETDRSLHLADLDLLLVPISAGTLLLSKPAIDHDPRPVRSVTLDQAFWLGETEVTQAQWQKVVGTNPSSEKRGDLPVEQITWAEAVAFCQALTQRECAAGRLPEGYTFDLPIEAQWEYACRATATLEVEAKINAKAWHRGNSKGQTQSVATKLPNGWGLYDMQGNVSEWCADTYGSLEGPITAVIPPQPVSTPHNTSRGGDYFSSYDDCFVIFAKEVLVPIRDTSTSDFRGSRIGFRIALNRIPSSP